LPHRNQIKHYTQTEEDDGSMVLSFIQCRGPIVRIPPGDKQDLEIEVAKTLWAPSNNRKRRTRRHSKSSVERIEDLIQNVGLQKAADLVGTDQVLEALEKRSRRVSRKKSSEVPQIG